MAAGLATTGCSSSLEDDSLSELPAAKNLDSVAISMVYRYWPKEQNGHPRVFWASPQETSVI